MTVRAVLFDWGGTLTQWHDIDFGAEVRALARAVVRTEHPDHVVAQRLAAAGDLVWGRARDHQVSATVADIFAEADLEHDPELLGAYREFWEPHTLTDPEVAPLLTGLRNEGVKVGVLSNTIWPRAWHVGFFERDGVAHLIDGDVYTSELPVTKPHPDAFRAAMAAVGETDPKACVYVGDRLFEDVWGPQQVGMRAVHVPHSAIPSVQRGHTEGTPDAVVQRLSDVLGVVLRWR